MATENFYVKKEDVEDHKKAKELLGDGYSSFIMKCLKNKLIEHEKQDMGFDDLVVFVGEEDMHDHIRKGNNIKFVGKLLSRAALGSDDIRLVYSLYLTRKGKLLLYKEYENMKEWNCIYSYDVKDRIQDFKEISLPTELLREAEKKLPGITCIVLDI